jgi:hypothetical protein
MSRAIGFGSFRGTPSSARRNAGSRGFALARGDRQALTAQDLRAFAEASVTVAGTPAFAAHVRADLARWMNVVKTTGIRVE